MDAIKAIGDNDTEELIAERDCYVPSIISSLDETDKSKLLQNTKLCLKYLPTYTIPNAVKEILQYITPVIKRCLQKIYEDNFLLSDTVDDDMIINIVKENLQTATDFITTIKIILNFLTENGEVNLNNLDNVASNLAEMILFSFEHCKNSADEYKTTFNAEILEIFRLSQEAHLLFLRLFETCIVIASVENYTELGEINKVLEIICKMSEVLSEISIKSMSDNWKGYIAILQKFSLLLSDAIDLKLPVQSLTAQISRNMNSLCNLDNVDPKLFTQVVKIAGFLIKVALKIFDIFWDYLENICQDLLVLCCTIYSCPGDIYHLGEYSIESLNLIEISFYKHLEPFLLRLASDSVLRKIIHSEIAPSSQPFGVIVFLNNILNCLVLNQLKPENVNVPSVISAIFNSTRHCYPEFFRENHLKETFENLVVNITACILIYGGYSEIEHILFKSILQDDIWSVLLAIEVWTLLLNNTTSELCLETLLNLMQKCQEIDFGTYTNRLEEIYLKCLMQRIFNMLSAPMKIEIINKYSIRQNTKVWKMIGFKNFPIQRKLSIEEICANVVDVIDSLENDNFSLNNFTASIDHLDVLSTVKFNEIAINSKILSKSVYSLWEFNSNPALIDNNAFKYYISKLCKITSNLMMEFATKELITVLTQLKFISHDDSYKLSICEILSSLSQRPVQYNQDESKINALAADIIYPNLLCTKKPVIKQIVLEVIHKFVTNGKQDIVKNATKTSMEMQGEISNYLQRNVALNINDKEHLALLGGFKFQHECIPWTHNTPRSRLKKRKTVEPLFMEESRAAKEKHVIERTDVIKTFIPATKIFQTTVQTDENVGEVLDNIKGEVKCLLNVLKTEKLSRKNASDIKLIANQLLSLL